MCDGERTAAATAAVLVTHVTTASTMVMVAGYGEKEREKERVSVCVGVCIKNDRGRNDGETDAIAPGRSTDRSFSTLVPPRPSSALTSVSTRWRSTRACCIVRNALAPRTTLSLSFRPISFFSRYVARCQFLKNTGVMKGKARAGRIKRVEQSGQDGRLCLDLRPRPLPLRGCVEMRRMKRANLKKLAWN